MMKEALTINMGVSQKEPHADIHVCVYIYICLHLYACICI